MIFLRHPTPDASVGLCYGRLNLKAGPAGATEIAHALRQTPKQMRIISSPADRCRGLAEALAARDKLVPSYDERLWEMDFGEWEGMSWSDIPREESEPWTADPWTIAPPGGETFAAVHARVADVIAGTEPGTALVCHAGPIRAARMILTGAGFAQVFAEAVPYASPIRFMRETA